MQLSSRDGVGSAYHCPRQGHGLNDLLGPGNQSKAAKQQLPRPLWGEWKKEAGSPAELCNQLPWSQRPWLVTAQHCGEGCGEAEAALVPSFAASPPDLTDLQGRHCLPSAPASSRHLPLGVENQEGLLSECVKQRSAGFPGRKSGPWLYTRPLGVGIKERSLGPSVTPSPAPSFLTPKLSPLPHREPTINEGPKGRGAPSAPAPTAPPSPPLGNLTSLSSHHLTFSSCPAQPPRPRTPSRAHSPGQDRKGEGMQERGGRKKSLSPLPVLRVTMTFIKSLPSLPIATTCNRGYYYLYFINEKTDTQRV